MSAKQSCLHITTFSLDGTSYLAKWLNLGVNHEIAAADARSGSDRYQNNIFGKRSSMFDFEIELNSSATTTVIASAVNVATWTAGAMDLVDDWKDFSIAYRSPVVDGSGGRSRDEYANYVGGCSIEVSGNFLVPLANTSIPALTAVLSNTAADQQLALTIATGAFSMNLASMLRTASWTAVPGDLQRFSLGFVGRGAPTNVTTGIFANILTGTGSDSLLTLAVEDVGGGAYEFVEAAVTELTITVAEGQVQKAVGKLAACAKPTYTPGS
ncbi:MAG: hypothetical protein JNK63_02455 [Chthonomonas sp.]|nr:hypothetical protein [Chthonomonas sp.]